VISVSDILKILDQIPIWKALRALPARVDALEQRLQALEQKAIAPPKKPGGITIPCPLCGEDMKLVKVTPHDTFGTFGVQQQEFHCACGHNEDRMHDPTGRRK
jgi:hypothetical protein